jgi:hypothetical protein
MLVKSSCNVFSSFEAWNFAFFLAHVDIYVFLQSKDPEIYSYVLKSYTFLLFALFLLYIFFIPLFCIPTFQIGSYIYRNFFPVLFSKQNGWLIVVVLFYISLSS